MSIFNTFFVRTIAYMYVLYLESENLTHIPCCPVSCGCIHDEIRTEPGSWTIVGMIPIFQKKVAMRAGRPEQGPEGCARRKIHLLHQCYSKLLEGWNILTSSTKVLQWADGVWRRSVISLAALLGDQPELDSFCCDGSQTCKVCACPKPSLCDISQKFRLRSAAEERRRVYRAADGGQFRLASQQLFDRGCRRDNVPWKPTKLCTKTKYERTRKLLSGKHLMENAFWGIQHFDVQKQVHICMYSIDIDTYTHILDTHTSVHVHNLPVLVHL